MFQQKPFSGAACTQAPLGSQPVARKSLEIISQATIAPCGSNVLRNVDGNQSGHTADREKHIVNKETNFSLTETIKRFC